MNKIFADKQRIFLDNWNAAYGNKVLHLLFLLSLCEKRNKLPVMYKGSNLDDIFEFKFELIEPQSIKIQDYFFEEKDSFYIQNRFLKLLGMNYKFFNKNLTSVIVNHYRDYLERKNLLDKKEIPENDIMIKGHFFEYSLMPSFEVFNKNISLRREVISYIHHKYPDIEDEKCVAVHYRGTDFSTHLQHLFPKGIQVDKLYYKQAVEKVESLLGNDITYHLFSDDVEFLKEIFKDKKVIVHNDKANEDWIAMFLMKNIIQTNSSFCWTASLYNKFVSIQPKDGYNYHQSNGSIPFDFHHKNAILISKGAL